MMNKLFFEPKSGEVMLLNPTMSIHKYLVLFGSPEQRHLLQIIEDSSTSEQTNTVGGLSKRLNKVLNVEYVEFGNGREFTKQDLDLFLLDAMKAIMIGRTKRLESKVV